MESYNCEYCGKAIEGAFVACAPGYAHSLCYRVRHPVQEQQSFLGVLGYSEGRAIAVVRTPTHLQEEIIDRYNEWGRNHNQEIKEEYERFMDEIG